MTSLEITTQMKSPLVLFLLVLAERSPAQVGRCLRGGGWGGREQQAGGLRERGLYPSSGTSAWLAPNTVRQMPPAPVLSSSPWQATWQPVPEELREWKIPGRCASPSASVKGDVTRKALHANETRCVSSAPPSASPAPVSDGVGLRGQRGCRSLGDNRVIQSFFWCRSPWPQHKKITCHKNAASWAPRPRPLESQSPGMRPEGRHPHPILTPSELCLVV